MTFKELKQGYPFFVLDKDKLEVKQCKVVSVSFPRVETMQNGRQMVVDVTVDQGGKTATYTMSEDAALVYANSLVLSTDQKGLCVEVEHMKEEAERVLASVERQKEIIDTAGELLAELNPTLKEKQETEKRFSCMEKRFTEIDSKMDRLITMIQTRATV